MSNPEPDYNAWLHRVHGAIAMSMFMLLPPLIWWLLGGHVVLTHPGGDLFDMTILRLF